MNYTTKDANKILVGDTLTLEDGTKHEAVKGHDDCLSCSIAFSDACVKWMTQCDKFKFHFETIKRCIPKDYLNDTQEIAKSDLCCYNCMRFVKFTNATGGRCKFSISKSVHRTDYCIHFKRIKL